MGTLYETDIVAWASEQAELLRSGQWSALDIEKIAEEIEDVGKSVQRELSSRVAVLLAHLLKWKFQPELRSKSWLATIAVQRRAIARILKKTPSLRRFYFDEEWLDEAWDDAIRMAIAETCLHEFPDASLWSAQQILDPEYFPD
jgi:ribosomal protein L29